MITAERFNQFTLEQQRYYAFKCGVYLSSHDDGLCSIDLFQTERFYVEIYYRTGEINCCFAKAFTDTLLLGRYLEQISISELL